MAWEGYRKFHWRMMRVLTRVMLWWWLLVGTAGFLVAVFHPAQADRLETALAFALGAGIGGGGLLLWNYIDTLKRRLRGKDQP
ncbi:hypothetical protein [Brevundimonas sp.]|uniref:hypothetical protein n=1 Tax=Brevundimonas sp. TaxID=1871086 RepID=UPI002CFBC0F5|nr:hypothetical protein [Brevundimonas sp.]HWQ85312.1 hypothetical protein [Brevundimonas sp.]